MAVAVTVRACAPGLKRALADTGALACGQVLGVKEVFDAARAGDRAAQALVRAQAGAHFAGGLALQAAVAQAVIEEAGCALRAGFPVGASPAAAVAPPAGAILQVIAISAEDAVPVGGTGAGCAERVAFIAVTRAMIMVVVVIALDTARAPPIPARQTAHITLFALPAWSLKHRQRAVRHALTPEQRIIAAALVTGQAVIALLAATRQAVLVALVAVAELVSELIGIGLVLGEAISSAVLLGDADVVGADEEERRVEVRARIAGCALAREFLAVQALRITA